MTGRVIIDTVDIKAAYGLIVTDFASLVAFPPLKEVDFNDWPDQDGIEVDLSAPFLDSKTITMRFGGSLTADIDGLIVMLSDGAYHDFTFEDLGITRKLRMADNTTYEGKKVLKYATLSLVDDFPLEGYEYSPPTLSGVTGVEIDGADLGIYGVVVDESVIKELKRSPSVKENLKVNKLAHGVLYDDENVYFKEKEVSLPCRIFCAKSAFWTNYNALLYDLIKTGERVFFFDSIYEEHSGYYKGSEVKKLIVTDDTILCVFDLNITLTSFRVSETDYVFADENGAIITDENDCAIETYM
jgi:hypothetical protein